MFRPMAMLRDRHKVQQMVDMYMFDCWLIFVILAFVLRHANLFSKIVWWYLIANKNGQYTDDLNLRVENKFFYFWCPQNIFGIFKHLPKGGRCIWEKHYIGIASSQQTSGFVIKMFDSQNFVVNSRVKSSLNLIAKTRLSLFWLLDSFDCYSLCYSFEFWLFFQRIISTSRQYVCHYYHTCNGKTVAR
jgi:hypothetical protein